MNWENPIYLKIIAGFQAIGGLLSAVSVLIVFASRVGSQSLSTNIFDILFLVGYLVIFYAGIQLWRHTELGYKLSFVVQYLQLIILETPVLNYRFSALLDATVYGTSGFSFGYDGFFALGGRYELLLTPTNDSILIGINLIAALILYILYKNRESIQQ